ncbi:FAD-dependent oxidoreductase [Hansschlegelia beijingensis]
MQRERLVIVGAGMASLKLLEELAAAAPDRHDVTVVGADPTPAYNRVLLSSLLAGEASDEDLRLRGRDWYAAHGFRLLTGVPAQAIDRPEKRLILNDGRTLAFDKLVLATGSEPIRLPLVAEPGRVIVARCLSVVVRVLLKKGQRLYINDGIWSSLSDSWTGKIMLPAQLIPDPARARAKRNTAPRLAPFRVCGATCDSVDILTRPFWLPDTVATGDWIEIGHIGAYSLALRTHFNGFYPNDFVEVAAPFETTEGLEGVANVEPRAAMA